MARPPLHIAVSNGSYPAPHTVGYYLEQPSRLLEEERTSCNTALSSLADVGQIPPLQPVLAKHGLLYSPMHGKLFYGSSIQDSLRKHIDTDVAAARDHCRLELLIHSGPATISSDFHSLSIPKEFDASHSFAASAFGAFLYWHLFHPDRVQHGSFDPLGTIYTTPFTQAGKFRSHLFHDHNLNPSNPSDLAASTPLFVPYLRKLYHDPSLHPIAQLVSDSAFSGRFNGQK